MFKFTIKLNMMQFLSIKVFCVGGPQKSVCNLSDHKRVQNTGVFACLCLLECGTIVNNSLRSPGYPKNYPKNMHCLYSVNIPRGMEIKIYFSDFEMEDAGLCL